MCLANKMAFLCKHFVLWGSPLLLLYLKKACAMHSDKKGNGSIRNDVTFVSIIKTTFPTKLGCLKMMDKMTPKGLDPH